MNCLRSFLTLCLGVLCFAAWPQTIHRTACQGKLAGLDSMLTDTTHINVQDERGRSLLHYAVGCRQKAVFDFLLDRGIDINIQDNRGETPLSVAIQINNATYFDPLIELQVASDFSRAYGAQLLELAVINENMHFVEKLIEKDVPLNEVNERGSTPLEIAIRENMIEIADHLIAKGADPKKVRTFELKGPYLGQPKPGLTASLFAPNFISTENYVHNGVFHPNGKEFYFTIETRRYHGGTIMVSKIENGTWSKPQPVPIPGNYREVGPYLSKDGNQLYFASNRPITDSDSIGASLDLWMLEREGDSWGPPIHLGNEVNTEGNDWFPTIANDGTLYFYVHQDRAGTIRFSENKDGKYQAARLVEGVDNGTYYNYDPWITPDESYLIFSSRDRPDGLGSSDLYISFRSEYGKWSRPINMGASVNSEASEYAPIMTPDGKFLFFTRGYGDIYWVDAKIIDDLR